MIYVEMVCAQPGIITGFELAVGLTLTLAVNVAVNIGIAVYVWRRCRGGGKGDPDDKGLPKGDAGGDAPIGNQLLQTPDLWEQWRRLSIRLG